MGNVLVRFDPELFMDRYSLTGEDRKLIRNEVFRSVEWTMLDRGVIDEEIAEQRILPRLPERLHDAARGLIEKWDDPIVPVEGMMELLQALKANVEKDFQCPGQFFQYFLVIVGDIAAISSGIMVSFFSYRLCT